MPMNRRVFVVSLLAVLAVALALQVGLFEYGFYRVTSDESARSLGAYELTWANALQPFLWPPFCKLFVGLAMKVFGNVFVTPRVLVAITGLLTILSLVALADALFANRTISLVTAVLAVPIPHRLIFSIVPLSDIYYFLFTISASTLVLYWLRSRARWQLFAGCACLLLAETVRFESGMFAAFLAAFLAYQWLVRREVGFATLAICCVILFAFPVLWVVNSYAWYGSFANLGITSQQFIGVYGRNYANALRWEPLRFFVQDILWNPLTLPGLAALAWIAWRDRAARIWVLLFGAPLLVFSAVVVATLSVPMAATWRTSGPWSLLVLPFDAFVAVRAMALFEGRQARALALSALLLIALLPMSVRSGWFIREGMHNWQTHHLHQERQLALYLKAQLAGTSGNALIDSYDNLDYMDVVAFSTEPDRMLLTALAEPVLVGVYVPMRARYVDSPDPAVRGYLTDHFDLLAGGSPKAFAKYDIRLVAVRDPRFIAALDASQLVQRAASFNDWQVYRVGKETQPSNASSAQRTKAPNIVAANPG